MDEVAKTEMVPSFAACDGFDLIQLLRLVSRFFSGNALFVLDLPLVYMG